MKNTSSRGMGFMGTLTILFIGLKLTDHIQWHWAWVLSPAWIPVSIVLAVIMICLAIGTFNQFRGK